MNKNTNILPVISAIVNAAIIGLSLLFTKNAVNILPPIPTLALRFLIAFLLMSLLILLKVIKVNYKNKNLKILLLFSIVQPVMFFTFQAYGMKYASSSEAGILMALIPIVTMIMSYYFLKESISIKQGLFAFLSVSGVIFISIMKGISCNDNFLGPFLILLSVLSTSVYMVTAKKLSNTFTPLELTYGMMLVATVFFSLCVFIFYSNPLYLKVYFGALKNKEFIISILYLSIFSSITTSFLSNYTVSKINASIAVIFSNLSTVVSIFAGVFILKENFYMYHFIGTLMILSGVIGVSELVQTKLKTNTSFKKPPTAESKKRNST